MSLTENYKNILERVSAACRRAGRFPEDVTVISVTKTVNAETVALAFQAGARNFGENRIQEAEGKIRELTRLEPRPVWHLIGHLQSNKAKTAVQLFDIIHSVDSVKLAETLNRHAEKRLPVLLEVNISGEPSKNGFTIAELEAACRAIRQLPNIKVSGLMTVAPLSADPEQVRPVFRKLRTMRDELKLEHLSMGMTDDFEVAIEEGATMVRIGRAIFGERTYP